MQTIIKRIFFQINNTILTITILLLFSFTGRSLYASDLTGLTETPHESQIVPINVEPEQTKYLTLTQNDQEISVEESAGTGKEKSEVVKLEKVEVTGTHIKRTDIEGPSPVLMIDREQIDQTGATTVSELLRKLPMNYGDSFDEKFGQGFSPGSSGISLRGLGQESTLVLLNGRRLTNHGFAQDISDTFVDLNSIPLNAIERVEVLKDGASAIYGSDAIAGVVNIILRKEFEGSEAALTYGGTSEGDGNETNLSLITGLNTTKSNLTITANYFHRSAISRADREFSNSADHTNRGGLDLRSDLTPVSNVIGLLSGPFDFDFATGEFDRKFDFNPYMTLVPETERLSAVANYTLELNPELSLFSHIGYSHIETNYQEAPTPLPGAFVPGGGPAFPNTHPDNTYGEDVIVLWRMMEWGNRLKDISTDNGLFVLGFEGIVHDWDWNTAVNYNRSETVMDGKNFVNLSSIATFSNVVSDWVIDDDVNPFGTTPNSQDVIDRSKINIKRTATTELYGVDAKTTGELFQLTNGPIQLALGAQLWHESLTDTPDNLTEQGLVIATGGTSTNGDRDIGSVFTEFSIPALESLELQLALRYENYSDFGDTTNPKIGLRYQPTQNWLLRGSWGTGFRAPSLPELYLGQTTAIANVNYLGNPDTTAVLDLKGNPDLQPTESESYNLGVLWEPIEKLAFQLDYWNYNLDNDISADPQYTVDNLPGSVTPIVPGVIAVDQTFYNIAKTKTDGLDIDIRYRWNATDIGTFTVSALATYVLSYERQAFAGEPWEDLLGTYRYPKWRATFPFGWYRGDHGASITANYIDSYEDVLEPALTVDSQLTWDLQYVYTGIRNSTLTLGVKNVTNEDPPFANEEVGYDFATHDPRGRFLYGTFAYKF